MTEPYYQDKHGLRLWNDDVLRWAANYRGPKFHALLTDPPYHLTSITERFGKANSAPAQFGKDGAFGRVSKGFMGQQWDGGDIAFQAETWAAFYEHMHPGAFGMAFASSRGWHRLACAIEDAGFIMHSSLFGWCTSQGFPKATRIVGCDCAERNESGTQKAWAGHSVSGLRNGEIQTAGLAKEGENGVLLSELPSESSNSSDSSGASLRPNGDEVSSCGDEGRKESSVEGRRDIQAEQGQLHRPEVCEVSTGTDDDGAQGRLYHGTSSSDGTMDQASAHENGSGTSHRSQHAEQPSKQSRTMARQSKSQDSRSGAHCDRCGKPIVDIWQSHRYGLQAIKPALEPIILFQKPYEGRAIDNMTTTGAGALWIDGARIGAGAKTWSTPRGGIWTTDSEAEGQLIDNPLGRWPANLTLIHHPACDDLSCVPECPIMRLGEQSGVSKAGVAVKRNLDGHVYNKHQDWGLRARPKDDETYADEGTAARYFYDADWMYERIEAADPVIYCPKPSTAEREAGLSKRQKQIVNDGRDTPIDNPYQRGDTERLNTHPTIKPISLTQHLATLLLPPAAYGPRKLLIPFSGAGSECIGAFMAGWEEIEAIELGTDHCAIAQARWQYWSHKRLEVQRDGARHVKKAKNKHSKDQPRLFDD